MTSLRVNLPCGFPSGSQHPRTHTRRTVWAWWYQNWYECTHHCAAQLHSRSWLFVTPTDKCTTLHSQKTVQLETNQYSNGDVANKRQNSSTSRSLGQISRDLSTHYPLWTTSTWTCPACAALLSSSLRKMNVIWKWTKELFLLHLCLTARYITPENL